MKKRSLTALLVTLLAALSMVLGGCSININLPSETESATSKTVRESLSQITDDFKSELNDLHSKVADHLNDLQEKLDKSTKSNNKTQKENSSKAEKEPQESGGAVYTMADVKKLKNTGNFAKNTLEHIFDGTINSKGNATGYHYSMISDSKGEIIPGTESKKDSRGVFTAKVKVSGVKKNGFSSFYPESWTPQQVVDAINEAYSYALNDSSNPHGSLWIGYSGDLEIDMYLNDSKKITTAYPIYEGE